MTWPPLLKSAEEKLRRADGHIGELDIAFKRFTKEKGYVLETQADFNTSEVLQRVFIQKPLPAVEFGVLVGDVVHNLRSALDHLAWALTVYHQRRVPKEPLPVRDCWWRDVGFPIYRDGGSYGGQRVRKMLQGLDPQLLPRFKAIQPFAPGEKHAPERTLLWILQELWNRDKHRSVLGVGTRLSVRDRLLPEERFLLAVFGDKAQLFAEGSVVFLKRARGPVKDGDVVLHVRFEAGIPDTSTLRKYLNKYARPEFDIAFERGRPTNSASVRRLLRAIRGEVGAVIEGFLPEFDPPRRIARPADHCPDLR